MRLERRAFELGQSAPFLYVTESWPLCSESLLDDSL